MSKVKISEDCYVDFEVNAIYKKGMQLPLSYTESRLLKLFAEKIGRMVTYRTIIDQFIGIHPNFDIHDLYPLISRIRKKLEVDNCKKILISVKGSGYILLLKD